jgi:hypothetical protein
VKIDGIKTEIIDNILFARYGWGISEEKIPLEELWPSSLLQAAGLFNGVKKRYLSDSSAKKEKP